MVFTNPTININDKVSNLGTTPDGKFDITEFNYLKSLWVALINVNALTDAAQVVVDASKGVRHDLTLTGDGHTIQNPTNGFDGQTICLAIKQGPNATAAGGYKVLWDSKFHFSESKPLIGLTLSQLNNQLDYVWITYRKAADVWDVIGYEFGY
jgi:hypothetical protein